MARRRLQTYLLQDYDAGVTPGDDVNVKTLVGLDAFDEFCIEVTQGTCRIFASLDGTNFMAKQLILCQEPPNTGDTVTAQDPVFVAVASANVPAWFFGNYKSLRIQQEGATALQGRFVASGEKP